MLMLVMFVSISPVSAMETAEEREAAAKAKIDSELLEAMEAAGEDELLPIWIWRESIQEEEIYDLVREEKGYDPDLYEDDEAFEEEVRPEIEKQIEEIVGYEEAHEELMQGELVAVIEEIVPEISEEISPELADELASAVEGVVIEEALELDYGVQEDVYGETEISQETTECDNASVLGKSFLNREDDGMLTDAWLYEIDDITEDAIEDETYLEDEIVKMTVADFVVNEEMDTYVLARNEIIGQEYTKSNDEFIEKYVDVDEQEILYSGGYTSTVIVMATKADINEYAKLKEITGLSLYEENLVESNLDLTLNQVGVYGPGGTGVWVPGGWTGYIGLGIKIGILEAEGGVYDSVSPQLRNANVSLVQNIRANGAIVPYSVKSHATMVTSIIAGKLVLYNGKYYEGVVPSATVYQMPTVLESDILTGMVQLANRGVQVINFSGGVGTSNEYMNLDYEVDKFVKNTGIVFVNSAGNRGGANGAVTSPGKGLNVISVGNTSTKTSSGTAYASPYLMSATSSYVEASYLPNKPDISAPGSNISWVVSGNKLDKASGTSCAAPIVTGIIAQMLQAKSGIRNNPTMVKAILMLSAERSKISTSGNLSSGNYMYEKSGAGFVNAIKTVNNCFKASQFVYKEYKLVGIPESEYFNKGDKIRAVMTFNKNNGNINIQSASLRDDLDLSLVNRDNNEIVATSRTSYENVEIIEYTVTKSGRYYIIVDSFRIADNNNRPDVAIAISWL